ncbi:c-type cytochrome [Aeoliella mucimassa]|uniref:c-type cytochrome n=1 Tax=Aeoliella mucimassa TaxID=2527972 RepID=UPI0018D2E62E|nr:c-type cytochrome [Aeoliella mucimassa]
MFPYYPVNGFGPVMQGMVIGGLGIFHVFVAQFAIGGGMLLCYFQWRANNRDDELARRFVDGYFRWLVLVSFVTGAVTGVAMWFTTIQISPRTIGMMIDEFHWLWATEWTFFCLEVASGYIFYRYAPRLDGTTRLRLLILYAIAAWMSLFWINGILSWQLTPSGWLDNGSVWAGFFNATFWPSLVYRTLAAMAIAGLVAALVVNLAKAFTLEERRTLIRRVFWFLAPMALMPLIGGWFMLALPEDSRQWIMGGSIAMTLFFSLGAGASLLIGGYGLAMLVKSNLTINGATASLLCALAFAATAGGEFVREGVRKPYTVRHTLYSNSITEDEVAYFRRVGCTTNDPYPLVDADSYPTEQLQLGAHVFRMQCGICHTMDGANGLVHLAGTWSVDQQRLNIAKLQHTKAFMPPFAGTPEELEALVQLIRWQHDARPTEWSETTDASVLESIAQHLEEAGTRSMVARPQ